ncbi:hypothetical protein J31TS4_09340 [Paenibacillus sp. J31TS4]|uniref:D-glycero-alpha-D-manno-heptose-1,7-bisphosphate 7-phosphatase n=1 Tax=Paenibacillus sp. J31TS4 TaxID=2807195 RepID=UPI001B277B34|nr:HAD family hydrolase [Paenibacillus sp. J31TS4]GIP37654.1 hypothetical protein J31TS4_09340 [Paenibacillus sp. J31TS4]
MQAVFLDRDGVLNRSHSLNHYRDFRFLEGAREAVRLWNELGYEAFVVTNQGGVGLGYMTEEALRDIHERMVRDIEQAGGRITDVSACIHKPGEGCACRKPEPGMLLELIERYGVDPSQSFMIGDRDVDIRAGEGAGLRTIFIGDKQPPGCRADYQYPSLLAAVQGLREAGVLGEGEAPAAPEEAGEQPASSEEAGGTPH